MNATQLIEMYGKSHFVAFVDIDRVASVADQERAKREYERDPVAALVANVNQARDDVRATERRLMSARQDGLWDKDSFRVATRDEQRGLVAAMDTIRGDVARARSELEHWRGYVRWATEEQEAKVARLEAMQDPRLPPEHEDEVAF